jgi:hypothetical protein
MHERKGRRRLILKTRCNEALTNLHKINFKRHEQAIALLILVSLRFLSTFRRPHSFAHILGQSVVSDFYCN